MSLTTHPLPLVRRLKSLPAVLRRVHSWSSPISLLVTVLYIATVIGVSALPPNRQVAEQITAAKSNSEAAHKPQNSLGGVHASPPGSGGQEQSRGTVNASTNEPAKNALPPGKQNAVGASTPLGSKRLAITPAAATFTGIGQHCVTLTVAAADGLSVVGEPHMTYASGVVFGTPQFGGGSHATWTVDACRASDIVSGSFTSTFSAQVADGSTYSGAAYFTVQPVPYFTGVQGPVTQSESGDSVTFTFHFSIVPTANFGTPILRMHQTTYVSCTGGTLSIVTRYDGQKDFALSCVMSRMQAVSYGGFNFGIEGTGDDVGGGFNFNYFAKYQP